MTETCEFEPMGFAGLVKCRQCGHKRTTKGDPSALNGKRKCPAALTRPRPPRLASPVFAAGDDPDWWPKDADGDLIPQSEITADDLPCPHRGAVVKSDVCDVCGIRGQPFEALACSEKGLCSLTPKKHGVANCLKCDVRHAAIRNPLGSLPVVSVSAPKRVGPVRVCLLTPDMGAGGAERQLIDLAASMPVDLARVVSVAIVRDGQKFDPVCHEMAKTGAKLFGTRGVKWGHQPGPDNPVTWCQSDDDVLRRASDGVDVVISWGITGPDAMLVGAGWRGPHVVVSHGCSEWSRRHLATTSTPYRVAVSRIAATSFGEGPEPKVIWNGSSAERLRPLRDRQKVRDEWGLLPDDIVIGQVGRISPEKNPGAVALAVAAIQRRIPDRRVRGVLVGSGLPGPVADVLADARDVAGDAVRLIPPPRCIGDAYAAFDLSLLCSPEEGFGLVVTEAALAGVPQVVTRTGIAAEIEERWPGLLTVIPVEATEDELATACELAMSEANRHNVREAERVAWEYFSASRMGDAYARYLVEIVGA